VIPTQSIAYYATKLVRSRCYQWSANKLCSEPTMYCPWAFCSLPIVCCATVPPWHCKMMPSKPVVFHAGNRYVLPLSEYTVKHPISPRSPTWQAGKQACRQ